MKRFATIFALTAACLLSQVTVASAQNPNIRWRFGMNVSVTSTGFQKGLMVRSVSPGSPASNCGLRPGMVILTANGRNFNQAQNDFHGVALLQNAVDAGGSGGVPTVAYNNNSGRVSLVVLKPCGSQAYLTCFPHYVGGGGVPTSF